MRTARIIKKTSTPGSLYRLIYRSRNIMAQTSPGDTIAQEIRALLATARRCNKADDVTGALLFTASGFAQVLEGPRDVIERTFERIDADPRHTEVTVLSFTPATHRSFPDWPVGFSYQASSDAADPLAPLLADTASTGPRATTGSDVLRLLEKVVQQEDGWIAP